MFLQVPLPQGCRSHSSISAQRRAQLIQGLGELRATVLGVQMGSRYNTPVAFRGSLGPMGHRGPWLPLALPSGCWMELTSILISDCQQGSGTTLTHAHGLLPRGLEAVVADADVAALGVHTVPVAADVGDLLAFVAT